MTGAITPGASPVDELARLLKIDRALLEEAVPGIDAMLAAGPLSGLAELVTAGLRRDAMLDSADDGLRAQILKYHASGLMTDRERAAFFGLPEGCRMRERAKILAPEKLQCGRNVWIGEGAMLDAQGGLTIGDGTQIGGGVFVWTHSSHLQAQHKETCVSKEHMVYKPTRIGSHCFIVGPTVITAGVTIGDGAVISPLTFIDRDVAEGERVSGPRTLRKLEERIDELERRLTTP
ncbi:acyltransferase [Novosphingobium beihaiensis]|uniref:Acyltransferase n=1 Tax=Novosphingobium beihaiensis TaxID=2930389 RepID=A0ABT0BTG8_9SPHN|nr:acyltransferase [Novosphingobium beihaiensis]MCJ2188101.1 acyltransferase [Novosphingobium beihaiensis]